MSLASLIKRLQDIMRKDSGVDGDAQRLAQIVWLIFLKVYDYKEEEAELDDDYVPVIPKGYRWRDWAVGTSVKEQMTGPDLLDFVNNKLIPALGGNPITVDVPIDENGNEIIDKAKMKFAKGYKQVQKIPFDKTDDRSLLVKDVMGDATNYMKNGYLLRDVVNLFNEVDLEDSGAAHDFNDMYEGLLRGLQSAGTMGEFYTNRAITNFAIEKVNPQVGGVLADWAAGTGGFLISALDHMIGSMTEFKQIIGRGTRIKQSYECDGEEKSKMYFTILDFRKNYLKFNDPTFDGTPVTVTDVPEGNDFPKPPIKPVDPPPVHPVVPHRVARVNGVDVSIVGEDVQYLDLNGNLVTQNISSCIRNNIITQYPTFEEFRAAWLLANDKARFASELLLGIDWSSGYKTQYGYTVDDFDIIAHMGYDIEPPMSKHQRTHSAAIAKYLEQFDDEKKEVIRLLLDAYAETNFTNLRDVKNIFAQPQFADIGLTPLKAVKQIFGGKEKYFECLNEIENKLYEE